MDTMCMGDGLSMHRGAWRLYTTFLLGLLASGHPQNPVSPHAKCHLSGLPLGSHGAMHGGSGWTLPCATVQVPNLSLTVLAVSPGGPATSQHPAGVGNMAGGVYPWPGCWVGTGVLGTSTGGSRSRSPEGLMGVGDTQPGPARRSLFLNDASVRRWQSLSRRIRAFAWEGCEAPGPGSSRGQLPAARRGPRGRAALPRCAGRWQQKPCESGEGHRGAAGSRSRSPPGGARDAPAPAAGAFGAPEPLLGPRSGFSISPPRLDPGLPPGAGSGERSPRALGAVGAEAEP